MQPAAGSSVPTAWAVLTFPARMTSARQKRKLNVTLNNHQLKADGLKIGRLNRRLKEKMAESRSFGPQATRPSSGLKAASWKIKNGENGKTQVQED